MLPGSEFLSLDEIRIAGMEMALSSHDEARDLIRHRISPFIAKEKTRLRRSSRKVDNAAL